jgi:hypothetical protein
MDPETRTQVRTGRCPEHGAVRAVREMPKPQWPFVVYLFRRFTAGRAPFACPECGQPVSDVEKQ